MGKVDCPGFSSPGNTKAQWEVHPSNTMKTTGGRIQEMPSQTKEVDAYRTTSTSSSLWSKPVVNSTGTGVVPTFTLSSPPVLLKPRNKEQCPLQTAGHLSTQISSVWSWQITARMTARKGTAHQPCHLRLHPFSNTLPSVLAAAATPAQNTLLFLL